MAFTLLACSDIRAQKINLELPFEAPPCSLDDLRAIVQAVFRSEETALKQSRGITDARPCEPFILSRVQRYDDDTQRWFDVTSISQLQPYDQLYIFRKSSAKDDISPQRELPAPRLSPYFAIEVKQKTHSHSSNNQSRESERDVDGREDAAVGEDASRSGRIRRRVHRSHRSPRGGGQSPTSRRLLEEGGLRNSGRPHVASSMPSVHSGSDGVARRGHYHDERETAHTGAAVYHEDSDAHDTHSFHVHSHTPTGNTTPSAHRMGQAHVGRGYGASAMESYVSMPGHARTNAEVMAGRSPRRARSGSRGGGLDELPRTTASASAPYSLRNGGAADKSISASHSYLGGLRSAVSSATMHPCVSEGVRLEQVRYLFELADETRSGVVTLSGWEGVLRSAEIHFPLEVVHDLFQRFARQERGRCVWMLEDFHSYAEAFPVAVSVAYQRLTNRVRAESLRQDQLSNAREMAALQKQLADLEARLSATRSDLIREEQRHAQLQDEMAALTRQQDTTYCREEQTVLDKEVSVFRYRERLAREERDYERLALERQRRTAYYAGGTPESTRGGAALSGRPVRSGSYDRCDERYGPSN